MYLGDEVFLLVQLEPSDFDGASYGLGKHILFGESALWTGLRQNLPVFDATQVKAIVAFKTGEEFFLLVHTLTLADTVQECHIYYIRYGIILFILRFRDMLILEYHFGLVTIYTFLHLDIGGFWHLEGREFEGGVVGIELGELVVGEIVEVGIRRVWYFWLGNWLIWGEVVEAI